MTEKKKPGKLRKLFNAILYGTGPRRNADGTITTKHGRRIIPSEVTYHRSGACSANVVEFQFQPRVRELRKQMEPLLSSKIDDKFVLHPDTGNFYLQSDIDKNGVENATALGQIDMDIEKTLFNAAAQWVVMSKLFRGCSHENPMTIDEGTGRVYPVNNPGETRGHIKFGPKVDNSAADKNSQKPILGKPS